MDGNPDKGQGHAGMQPVTLHNNQPVSLGNPIPTSLTNHLAGAKSMETESMEMIGHVQELLNQLSNRGVNSLLLTAGPLGEIEIHGSLKGQAFLKDNADFIDRFSKVCSDDVWTLIGVQKRFLELGRANQNKPGHYNEKVEYPLDFSHERGSYFPGQQPNDRPASQDNTFVQGIISQGMNQSKGNYQTNTFVPGTFSQYMGEGRPSYPTVSFFQGGFSQGAPNSETYPQPAYMPTLDTTTNKENYGNLGTNILATATTSTAPITVALPQGDKHPMTQSEDDLIKEMLNSTPLQDVFKDAAQKQNLKEKDKAKKDSDNKRREAIDKRKRERRPETWQRNIKKKLKTEGKAYVNAKGKLVPAKALRSVDCTKCKLKCTSKISEETRIKIFDWFWKLGSYTAQKEFVVSRVSQVATKTSKRRHVHRLFSFEINGKYEPVCKPFFSKTLGIGDSYIYKAFEQKARDLFVQDGRGKHAPVNKTSQDQIEFMHQHLDRHLSIYPEDKPLPKNIHAVKWYDEYIKFCEDNERKFVSKHIYRKLFQDYTRKYPPNPEKKKPGEVPVISIEADQPMPQPELRKPEASISTAVTGV